nr:hypothetical protein Q903MT_gene1409 [Picea sitchensis]
MEFTSHHSFPPCGLLGELIRLVFTSINAVFWSLPSDFTKAHGSPGKDLNASYLTNAFIKWKKRG